MPESDVLQNGAPPGATHDASPLRFRERVRQRIGTAELLLFRVGREGFGVEIRAVDEVVESPRLRVLPDAPATLLGVFTLREQLLPLYAASLVLGQEAEAPDLALVMRSGLRRVGLAVDDVEEVVTVSMTDLRDPPPGIGDDDVVAGLVWRDGRIITVLDARALVAACATVVHQTVP
jgi:purine-binding chemotaxis protein CheW